jgi:deoxycytidylate deaminase
MSKPGNSNNGVQDYVFDWSDFAFSSKKSLKELRATFIAAPRDMSDERFVQLIGKYLPQGNIIIGISKEQYVSGYDEQPQFKMLSYKKIQSIIHRTNERFGKDRVVLALSYFQRELPYILEKIPFQRVVLVNGSWRHAFHFSPAYYVLAGKGTPYDMVSPFKDEDEAKLYGAKMERKITTSLEKEIDWKDTYTDAEMLGIASKSARRSFDYSFQTGLSLGKRISTNNHKFRLLFATYNKVVPYQTFAMHHGSLREKHFSPPNDLNYYDAVHAEVDLLIEAQKGRQSLKGTTLFINLMPCPSCARMLSKTDISEFVYILDHSDGYAVQLLEASSKKVYRHVPPAKPAL